jgi:SPP1 family predicted phage head-tail adaptor
LGRGVRFEAGKARDRVTLQSPTVSRDDYRAPVDSWTDVITLYAMVITEAGREFYDFKQRQAELTHLIVIRYDSLWAAVSPRWRAQLDGSNLNILSAITSRKKDSIVLLCSEVVD